MRERIAIVGAGVSGLAAARHLAPRHAVTVFEAKRSAGGHAHTVVVDDGDGKVPLDTGFLVYNERTYPLFTGLLASLGVATRPSEMSFSVQCRRCDVEYSGSGLRGLFARRRQFVRPTFLRMLIEILCFNRRARTRLGSASAATEAETLGDFLRTEGFSRELVRHYVVPMGAAIWSSKTGDFERFPLGYFLRFFDNHGLLRVSGQPPWRTIVGGSREYVMAIVRNLDDVRLSTAVRTVRRVAAGVEVETEEGEVERFDRVILAVHSDQALRLLDRPSDDEREALSRLPYQPNEAVLHTDASVLPRNPAAWASWNVHLEDCERTDAPLSMTYWLNRLQGIDSRAAFCVTLNDDGRIREEHVLERIPWEHPMYSTGSLEARERVHRVSGAGGVFFCGAWMGYGFHEDGVRSGLEVANLALAERRVA